MKKYTITLLLLLANFSAWTAPDPSSYFVITIKTDNSGSSNNNQFKISTFSGQSYEYSVDCDSNGSLEAMNQTGDYTCTYGSSGTYQVRILGDVNNGLQGFPQVYFANGGDKLKVLSIDQWGIGEWSSMAGAFWGASNMTVNATDVPNFDSLTNLRLMFNGAVLANPDTSSWNVSGVTDMTGMFQGASAATPDVSSWNTGNVELLNYMFAGATSANPDMSTWDIHNVTDMTGMFNLVTLPKATYDAALRNFASQPVNTNINFHAGNSKYCAISQHLKLTNPATINWSITDGGDSTFCYSIDDFQTAWNAGVSNSITIPTTGTGYYYRVDWNNDGDMNDSDESIIYTGDATHTFSSSGFQTIRIMGVFPRIYFNNIFPSTNTAKITNILQWGTNQWQSMANAFAGTVNLNITATDYPDLSQAISADYMFRNASLVNPDTSQWDTSNIQSMEGMFKDAINANPDTSQWDTSNVTNMSVMFAGAINANPDVSLWDTSNVAYMLGMFQGAIKARPDTSLWNTSKVLRMEYMFDGASKALPDTSHWDTSSVQSMDYMFRNVPFANPDTRNWDIGSVKFINLSGLTNLYGFRGMFAGVKLNTNTYDAILNKFASTANFNDLELDAGSSNLCQSVSAKFVLENDKNWTITDSGQNCTNESDDFVIVVKTDNPGATTSTQFRVPVFNDLNNPHNYFISCLDNGAYNAGGLSGSYTCNYSSPGIYQIRIVDGSGNGTGFPNIYFNNSGDRLKILDIKQWGTGKWKTMKNAFWGTANMIVTARDKPDLSQVTSLENMFRGARRVNPDTESWDMSNITTMKRMFAGAYVANPDTHLWDTANVNNMSYMFYQAYSANPDMSGWNIGQVTIMFEMFNGVNLPIPTYDAALINFDSQVHNSNVNLTAGTSQYCDAANAKANLIANGWNITDGGQECTPAQPTFEPQQLSAPNDNTPYVKVYCSEVNNVIKIFFTGFSYNFTQVASHTCTVNGQESFNFVNPVLDGSFKVQTTESKNGFESIPSELPVFNTFFIDTGTPPDPTSISLAPNPAKNGDTVVLNLTGIKWGAHVSVVGMTCSPAAATIDGFIDCSGVVGQNGLDGTNNTITISSNGNLNTNTSTGLIVDNDAPLPPVINPVSDVDTSITGTAEVDSVIAVSGATCSNTPVQTNNSGNWSCSTSGLIAGTVVTATATDGVGNISNASMPVTISGTDNTPPNAPTINAISDISTVITGTAEVASRITLSNASCSNSPVITNNNGDWSCTLVSSLSAGTQVSATATDAANNTSAATVITVTASSAIIFVSGFE